VCGLAPAQTGGASSVQALIGSGTQVGGAKEYDPPTRRGSGIDGRLVPGQVESPPKHAAIFVEEITAGGYPPGVAMIREEVALASRASHPGPGQVVDRAGGLYLVNQDRRLSIWPSKLLPINPFGQTLVIVVRPAPQIPSGQKLVTNQVYAVVL
jgi:hypothetical protein